MNNRVIAGLLALGMIVGALAVFPLARASQPVKTVTKTQAVYQKITNGEKIDVLAKELGTPAAQTTKATASNHGVSCWAWLSKPSGQPVRGDWVLTLCVKTQ